jgi:hypothetical protein
MKLSNAVQLSVIVALAVSTTCGASTIGKKTSTVGATSTGGTVFVTPELQTADARVQQAENQLDLARKQLNAAKSILKAAEADLKAARAERQAIALRTQAQDLAQDAGMRPEGNRALAEVDSAAVTANKVPVNAAPFAAPSTPARSQEMEFAPAPAPAPNTNAGDSVSPQLELR